MLIMHTFPAAGQSLFPIGGTPSTLKSQYYDIDGDGIQEFLDEINENGEHFYAWRALDGTIKQRIAAYSDACYAVAALMELNSDGQPEIIFNSNGGGNTIYLSQLGGG